MQPSQPPEDLQGTALVAIQHICEIQQAQKVKEKINSMKNHLNKFLSGNYTHANMPTNKTADTLEYEDINESLVGLFSGYMIEHARKYCRDHEKLLQWSTIASYFSAFKNFFLIKFHDKPRPTALDDAAFARHTDRMLRIKTKMCIKDNESLFQQKETATEEDIIGLSAVCFWNGDVRSAEFLHLFRACINNTGRGSEVRYQW